MTTRPTLWGGVMMLYANFLMTLAMALYPLGIDIADDVERIAGGIIKRYTEKR